MTHTIGAVESAFVVEFGRNEDGNILLLNCKRMFWLAMQANQYVRFTNVCRGSMIDDWEINPANWDYAHFVEIYKGVIDDHIYARR